MNNNKLNVALHNTLHLHIIETYKWGKKYQFKINEESIKHNIEECYDEEYHFYFILAKGKVLFANCYILIFEQIKYFPLLILD